MKRLLTLIALGSASLLPADQYYQPSGYDSNSHPAYNNNGGGYQDQPNNANYYQQNRDSNQRQNPQGYSQRDDQGYQRNNQYDYQQQSPRNQSYNQNQQCQQCQRPGNQSYDRDQQRNYDNNSGSQKSGSQKAASDQEITKKVRDILSSGWFSKGFQEVSFDVYNGNVNLRGTVDTLENKNKVEDSVKELDGVIQVNNQITVTKKTTSPYSDSQLQASENKYPQDSAVTNQDRQLNAKIRAKLNGGWFSKGIETLVIKTANGVVVISGTVDKFEDIQKVNDQLKDIDGIKTVNNQLTVKNN